MGSGLSVISEDDNELIIRYSKESELEDALSIIKNESEKRSNAIKIKSIINNNDNLNYFNESNVKQSNTVEVNKNKNITITTTTTTTTTTTGETAKQLLSSSSEKKFSKITPMKKLRRKSYDVGELKVKSPMATAAVITPSSEITSSEITSNDDKIIDPNLTFFNYWNSVTDQPFCNVCTMAFKSTAHLDRHVKFSDLHAKNLLITDTDIEVYGSVADNKNTTLIREIIEGQDYKLLYYGSKFYWKSSETVDIYLYHHMYVNCIEVITFDLQRNRELQRICLSFAKLMEIVKPDAIKDVDSERSERIIRDRFAVLEDRDYMIETVSRHKLITYILNRLQYSVNLNNDDTKISEINFVLNEESASNPLLEKPNELIPLHVSFRRRSSSEEITNAINSLHSSHHELKSTVAGAEKIQNRVGQAIDAAGKVFGNLKEDYSESSKYKAKWLSSIRRVIQKNAVEKTKVFLNI